MLYHGSKEERSKLIRKISKKVDIDGKAIKPTIVTSYEIAMIDRPQLMSFGWRYLIVDEGHRIKNFNCRLCRFVNSLPPLSVFFLKS